MIPSGRIGRSGQLDAAMLKGQVFINDVIFAELSVRFSTIESLQSLLDDTGILLAAIPRPALFLAAKAFRRYRSAGGLRTGVLPDFFIGAHAAISGFTLLSRDAQRYRHYFPSIDLVAP